MEATERDEVVIARLRELGADLSEPREVEFFLQLPAAVSASAAADELSEYDAELLGRNEDGTWGVRAAKTMTVDEDSIGRERERLNAIAQRHGGVFDGWGTEA